MNNKTKEKIKERALRKECQGPWIGCVVGSGIRDRYHSGTGSMPFQNSCGLPGSQGNFVEVKVRFGSH
jgi:hypothetical protein